MLLVLKSISPSRFSKTVLCVVFVLDQTTAKAGYVMGEGDINTHSANDRDPHTDTALESANRIR